MEDHREETITVLNRLVELALAGAVRYTQYSMIFGHARIPIMHWMRQQVAQA
jgi:bacterioferritin